MANNVVPDPQPVTLEDAGGTAAGTAGNPIRTDPTGTTTQPVSGTVTVVGAAADGAAVSGNPVLIGGQDGTNAQSILTDTTGRQVVVGAAAIGATVSGSPVMIGGSDVSGLARTMLMGADNADNVAVATTSIQRVAAEGYVFDGSTWDRSRGDSTNGTLVNLGANNDVSINAGTALIGSAVPDASASVGTGLSTHFSSALSTTVTAVKASAGKLHGYNIYNPNSSAAFVQIFDLATGSVTLGTTTPKMSLCLPSNASATIGLDANFPVGISFATAISVAATTTATGLTAPSTGLVFNAWYI